MHKLNPNYENLPNLISLLPELFAIPVNCRHQRNCKSMAIDPSRCSNNGFLFNAEIVHWNWSKLQTH